MFGYKQAIIHVIAFYVILCSSCVLIKRKREVLIYNLIIVCALYDALCKVFRIKFFKKILKKKNSKKLSLILFFLLPSNNKNIFITKYLLR